ncbi:MAG: DUF1549 domain-containing protein, partial [Planctomycetes bacterium]|nr:DUF1549 domain-containing protein [Planctomycetota bacterium]
PQVADAAWVRNPIDRFILARLEAEKLAPAPEADRRTLARRAALDITGLPPEPEAVEAFVTDTRPDAYERYVDTLLATPAWGEHRGRYWLDYARYADTHGIHFDNFREMWTFREWVIHAFNANMPFDRFTEFQLAGDLVDLGPDAPAHAVADAQIGSGFHRCNMTTNEGGIIDEEYVVLYARDRTETTSTVWMGLTTGCAVCHDHKFDPITMKDFYALSAFFNNTTQGPRDGNIKDTPPILQVPIAEDRVRLAELDALRTEVNRTIADRRQAARPAFDAFIAAADAAAIRAALPQDAASLAIPLDDGQGNKARATLLGKATDLPLAGSVAWQPGPLGTSAVTLAGKLTDVPAAGDYEHDQPFTVRCWLRPPAVDTSYAVVARMEEAARFRGWDVWVEGRRVGMHVIHAWPDDALKVVADAQLPANAWTLVTLTYDGSGKAEGVKIYYDGAPQATRAQNDSFQRHSIKTGVPLTIGSRTPGSPAHGVGLAGLELYGRNLSAAEVGGLSQAGLLADIAELPAAERPKAAGGLYDWWLGTKDEAFVAGTQKKAEIDAEIVALGRRGAIAHVMNEKPGMPKA